MNEFSTEIRDFLTQRGFRVLKRKADCEFGDDRHWLVVQMRRDCPGGPWVIWVMKMTHTQRFSVESVKLCQPFDVKKLEAAILKVSESDQTLGGSWTAALQEAQTRVG